jgi:hypothetical protein
MLSDSTILQRIAEIISGAPFPSSRTMTKAERILTLIEEGRQSSGDRVKALILKWRAEQEAYPNDHEGNAAAAAVRCCARELEALLSPQAAPVEQGEDRTDQAIACLKVALTMEAVGDVKACIKAALDFATNDEEALAEGRQWAPANEGKTGRRHERGDLGISPDASDGKRRDE